MKWKRSPVKAIAFVFSSPSSSVSIFSFSSFPPFPFLPFLSSLSFFPLFSFHCSLSTPVFRCFSLYYRNSNGVFSLLSRVNRLFWHKEEGKSKRSDPHPEGWSPTSCVVPWRDRLCFYSLCLLLFVAYFFSKSISMKIFLRISMAWSTWSLVCVAMRAKRTSVSCGAQAGGITGLMNTPAS